MTRPCNIDARGKAVRFAWGVLMLIASAAVSVLILTAVLASAWWWLLSAGLLAAAIFAFYEARRGWCAVRAMGFKTPV